MSPSNVVTPFVRGGSTGMVGPRIGKVGSTLPEHTGESFIDEDAVDKRILSL